MKNIYPKTIFINKDGEIIPNNYNREEYEQRKQWYERRIIPRNKGKEAEAINQRYVMLEKIKERQLKIGF